MFRETEGLHYWSNHNAKQQNLLQLQGKASS